MTQSHTYSTSPPWPPSSQSITNSPPLRVSPSCQPWKTSKKSISIITPFASTQSFPRPSLKLLKASKWPTKPTGKAMSSNKTSSSNQKTRMMLTQKKNKTMTMINIPTQMGKNNHNPKRRINDNLILSIFKQSILLYNWRALKIFNCWNF